MNLEQLTQAFITEVTERLQWTYDNGHFISQDVVHELLTEALYENTALAALVEDEIDFLMDDVLGNIQIRF